MKKIALWKNWKRHAVVLGVLVLVGASVYLNWRYAGNVAESGKILGEATLVKDETHPQTPAPEDDYFATARLNRQQARDSAISLLQQNPDPTEEEIRQAIYGNLCRCTGYAQIVDAVKAYVAERKEGQRDEEN